MKYGVRIFISLILVVLALVVAPTILTATLQGTAQAQLSDNPNQTFGLWWVMTNQGTAIFIVLLITLVIVWIHPVLDFIEDSTHPGV